MPDIILTLREVAYQGQLLSSKKRLRNPRVVSENLKTWWEVLQQQADTGGIAHA